MNLLTALMDDCQTGSHLSPVGRHLLHAEMIRLLTQQSLLADLEKTYDPDWRFADLVIVLGLPRSGTTMLHNLLSVDPSVQTVPLWRAIKPLSQDLPALLRGEAEQHVRLLDRLSPDLRRIHPMEPDWPEECIRTMQITLESQWFEIALDVPRYSEIIGMSRCYDGYLQYRSLLAAVVDPTRRVVLKAPAHLAFADSCRKVFPEARFIWLHRDPRDVIPSFCRLVSACRKIFSSNIDEASLGPWWMEYWRNALALAEDELRAAAVWQGEYQDLVFRPERFLAELYSWLRWEPDLARERQAQWMAENGEARRNPIPSTAGEFGLTSAQVASFMAGGG